MTPDKHDIKAMNSGLNLHHGDWRDGNMCRSVPSTARPRAQEANHGAPEFGEHSFLLRRAGWLNCEGREARPTNRQVLSLSASLSSNTRRRLLIRMAGAGSGFKHARSCTGKTAMSGIAALARVTVNTSALACPERECISRSARMIVAGRCTLLRRECHAEGVRRAMRFITL